MSHQNDNEKVQRLTIELLKVYIQICEKYHLKYYFTGGALIGVLRHHGFIPWDDDIDVGMPRKDYEKFLYIMEKNPIEGYGICNRYTNPEWHFAMTQFVDLESEIVIHLAEKPRKANIWLDVFPLDGLPFNKVHRWLRVKNVLLHRYLVQIAFIDTQVDANRKRPMLEKVVLSVCKVIPFGKLINANKVMTHMEKVLASSDFYQSQYAGNMLGRYREREVVPQKYFGNPVSGDFEGIDVNIPEMSHELQTSLYGDYMKLPPVESRVAHNVTIIKCRELD